MLAAPLLVLFSVRRHTFYLHVKNISVFRSVYIRSLEPSALVSTFCSALHVLLVGTGVQGSGGSCYVHYLSASGCLGIDLHGRFSFFLLLLFRFKST